MEVPSSRDLRACDRRWGWKWRPSADAGLRPGSNGPVRSTNG